MSGGGAEWWSGGAGADGNRRRRGGVCCAWSPAHLAETTFVTTSTPIRVDAIARVMSSCGVLAERVAAFRRHRTPDDRPRWASCAARRAKPGRQNARAGRVSRRGAMVRTHGRPARPRLATPRPMPVRNGRRRGEVRFGARTGVGQRPRRRLGRCAPPQMGGVEGAAGDYHRVLVNII